MELPAELLFYGHIALLFAISYAIGRVAGPIVTRVLSYLTSKTASTLDDRLIASVKGPIESFFFLIVFYFLLHSFPELVSAASFLERYTAAILTLILAYLASEASGAFIRWYYDEGHKGRKFGVDLSLLPLARKVTKIAIYTLGLTLALSQTGFDVTGIIAITSVAGLILGLASQETLANIFAGIALQVDRPYHYGDYLKLPSGEIAIIRKIGMRTTRLQDKSHNDIIISNSEFAKMRVTNLSLPDDISIVQVHFELPNGVDAKRLKGIVSKALGSKNPSGLLLERGLEMAIEQVKPSSTAWVFSFWVKGYQHADKIIAMVNAEVHSFVSRKTR